MLIWANLSLQHFRDMQAATRISSSPRALSRSKAPTAFLSMKTMCKSLYVSFAASSFYYQRVDVIRMQCYLLARAKQIEAHFHPPLTPAFPIQSRN